MMSTVYDYDDDYDCVLTNIPYSKRLTWQF